MDGRKSRFSVLAIAVAAGVLVSGYSARADLSRVLESPAGPAVASGPVVVPGAAAPAVAPATPVSVTPPVTPVVHEAGKGEAPVVPVTPSGTTGTEKAGVEQQASHMGGTPMPPAPVIKEIEGKSIKPATTEQTAGEDGAVKKPASGAMGTLMSAMQVAGALAVVLGIVLIGRVLMKRFVPGAAVGSGKGVMETLARYPVGRNQSVVLLRIGSQIVALNQTKDSSQSILVINEPMEVARIIGQIAGQDPNSIQTNFNRALANARMDLESPEASAEMPDTMDVMDANRVAGGEDDLDQQLEEMAAAKRQLMELRAQVRSVRDNLPA